MAPIRRNPTLSDDLINEILLRLPVKSLVRFESVSKTWLSFIKDPAFVRSQLLRAMTIETDQTLIVKRYGRDNDFPVLHVDSRKFVARLNLPFPRGEHEETCYFRLVGSANGIVCVYATFNTRPTSIYLCNPAIRQYKLIPSYSQDTRPTSTYLRHESRGALGFGYDPIDHDFKVVRVGLWSGYFAEVYSNNRNAWRKVVDRPVGTLFKDFDVCVNGFLCGIGQYYGIGHDGIGQDGMVAFDLNKEVLNCAIKLPFVIDEDDEDIARVIEYNKCISIIILKHTGRSDDEIDCRFYHQKINVWMLDDDACLRVSGVEASWTPMLSINIDSPAELSDRYFTNGDFLLLATDDCPPSTDDSTDDFEESTMWILRNADMKEVKIITLSFDMAEQIYVHQMYLYTESLVSLAGFRPLNLNAAEDDN